MSTSRGRRVQRRAEERVKAKAKRVEKTVMQVPAHIAKIKNEGKK